VEQSTMMKNESQGVKMPRLPATELGPGSFPIGSAESRAAARFLLSSKEILEGQGTLLRLVAIGEDPIPGAKCTCKPRAGTFALCQCCIPPGMTVEEAERICAERKARVNA
jgi:hypothetical protein